MATESLVFKISATGVRQVQTNLASIGVAGDKAAKSTTAMNASLTRSGKNAAGVRTVSSDAGNLGTTAQKASKSLWATGAALFYRILRFRATQTCIHWVH